MRIKNFLKKTLAVILALAMIAPIMGNLEVNVKEVKAASSDDSLNVKCQVTQGVVTETSIDKYRNNYVIRFVSAVKDYTDYKEIGFKLLEEGQTQEKKAVVKTVFKRIESTTGSTATEKETYTFSPKVVNTDSEYFLTAKLPVAPEKMNVNYTVWAYGIKTDGTLVAGQKRCVSVNDGLKSCETINMSFENTKNVDLIGVTTLTANDTYSASVIGVDGTTVHVRISGVDKSTLKSATKFTFENDKGEEVGSEILRNLYTKYTGSGTADMSWYEEYYLADNNQKEYIIATSADLYGFAELANSASNKLGAQQTFEGKKIYLVSDIVVNDEVLVTERTDANYMKWISPDTNEPVDETTLYKWMPIANGSYFKGLFDGQMHSIYGIYCAMSQTGVGFFFKTNSTAELKNLKLINSYFGNNGYLTGSVVAQGEYTKLNNLYSDAIVNVTQDYCGGLVGRAYGVNMKQCWFDGVLSNTCTSKPTYGTGGLIGHVDLGSTSLENCLNTGYIYRATSNYALVGGLIGSDERYATANINITVTRCMNAGKIEANTGAAHIMGGLRKATLILTDCYSYGGESVVGYKDGGSLKVISDGTEISPVTSGYSLNSDAITSSNTPSNFLGEAARNNMPGFAFDTTWSIVQNENPVLQVFESEVIDTSWYDEDEDTYVLYDKADLWGFSALSQETDFAGKTIKLGNDIVINTGVATNWGTTAPKYAWTPASSSIPFAGTFDGGMHTISGLYMNSASECSGFFSKTAETAVIKNVKVENSYFTSTKPALGSIIGEGCGRLENVYSNAIVTGNDGHIGGLIGRTQGTATSLRYCWYEGTVINTATTTGTANGGRGTGGLIGCTKGATELDNCLNKGAVDVRAYTGSNTLLAGGLVGYVASGSGLTFTDSLNTGNVLMADNARRSGYFVGYYEANNITCNTSYGYGPSNAAGDLSSEQYKITVNYILSNGQAGSENVNKTSGITNVSQDAITGDAAATKLAGFDFVNTWQTVDGGTPILNFSTDLENMDKRWYDSTVTEFVLYDKGDLYGFAELSKTNNFSGKTVKLGNDIVLNEGVAENWDTNPHNESWTPIGIETCWFRGTFDGDMHTISGLYMNTTVKGSGLFGITGPEAVIRNVKLTNSYFESTARELGSIVGRLRGKVYMVYSDAIMKSANTMYGGIAGITCGSDVELENCWYAGSITTIENQSDAYGIGGIVGCATAENTESQLTIRNCLNTANFDITTYTVQYPCTGGIVGRVYHNGDEKIPDVEIDSCLNTGTFTTNSDVKAGYAAIVGYVDNKEEHFKAKVQIYRTYATEAMDNAFNVDSTGIYVVAPSAIQGSDAKDAMPHLGWGTDWKCGEEGKFPEIIFSTSGYGEGAGVTASAEEQATLASYYEGRVLYQGDIHGHAKTYDNSANSLTVIGDDGKVDLATWAKNIENKTVDLDFAASLDHHQVTHIEHDDWDPGKFIYGTEAGTRITDLEDAGGLEGKLHYNMLFPNDTGLRNVLAKFSDDFKYGQYPLIREDYFGYPNFTKENFTKLIGEVRKQGGFFVHAHPAQSSYSKNTLDYYFADHTGFEVFYTPAEADDDSHPNGAYGADQTLINYKVWDELLKAGKRLYATAGSDTHGALNTYAVTSVYSDQTKADADKGEIINQLRDGDFVAGAVGMQMCIGNTVMGGTCDFDGQKLIVDINNFHSSVIKEGHRYRVDILNEKGVVLRQMVTPEQGLSIAMNVDANSKYYRVEVTDLTGKYLIAIGNPIWNAKFINAE